MSSDLRVFARGHAEIGDRLRVDREIDGGRAVFRRHVGDRAAVGDRQQVEPGAEELDELVDHAEAAQLLRDRQHQVGWRHALAQSARDLDAHHLGQREGDRLADHHRFRLDAADAPAEDAEPVDHRRVAVGADQRVGIGERAVRRLLGPHHAADMFEVELVHDALAGRHDAHALEALLAPAQEGEALGVAVILDGEVARARLGRAEHVDLQRMIDDDVDRHLGLDRGGIAAGIGHRVAQRGDVDQHHLAQDVLAEDPVREQRQPRADAPVHQAVDLAPPPSRPGACRAPPGASGSPARREARRAGARSPACRRSGHRDNFSPRPAGTSRLRCGSCV